MLPTGRVLELVNAAADGRRPFSLSRFGHGEIYVAAHLRWPGYFDPDLNFLRYAGVTDQTKVAARAVLRALTTADVVGLLSGDRPFEAPLTRLVLQHYGITPRLVCDARTNHDMIGNPRFYEILAGRRILVVGRRAARGKRHLEARGLRVVGTVPLDSFEGLPAALEAAARRPDFDVALVSAGVPAALLCPRLACRTGKVALDFGHALDLLMEGEAFDHERLVEEYNRRMGCGRAG